MLQRMRRLSKRGRDKRKQNENSEFREECPNYLSSDTHRSIRAHCLMTMTAASRANQDIAHAVLIRGEIVI